MVGDEGMQMAQWFNSLSLTDGGLWCWPWKRSGTKLFERTSWVCNSDATHVGRARPDEYTGVKFARWRKDRPDRYMSY